MPSTEYWRPSDSTSARNDATTIAALDDKIRSGGE